MEHHPRSPEIQHVWVSNRAGHGAPDPGVVVGWQWNGIRGATQSGWLALVVTAPYGEAVLISWVEAERLTPVRDPAPRA